MQRYLTLLKSYWIVAVVIVLALAATASYMLGYRIDRTGISKAGTLELTVPQGSRVYLDESRLLQEKDGVVRAQLLAGAHSVIVDTDGMQPWNELVELSSGERTMLSPIEVPKDIVPVRLSPERLAEGYAALRATPVPTQAAPLALDACVSVWASGSRILASASSTCTAPAYLQCTPALRQADGSCPATLIFAPNAIIRSVIAYPGRNDALIVAAGALSYVIELDPRKPQFFAPLLKTTVTLAPWTPGHILINDAGTLFELGL